MGSTKRKPAMPEPRKDNQRASSSRRLPTIYARGSWSGMRWTQQSKKGQYQTGKGGKEEPRHHASSVEEL